MPHSFFMKKIVLFFLFPIALCAFPTQNIVQSHFYFTGPLLAPSGVTNPKGVVSWQPYLYVINSYGEFDNSWKGHNTPNKWITSFPLDVTYGLNSFMDFEFTPTIIYATKQGSSSLRISDMPIFLSFQALREKKGTWIPNLRISLKHIFPIGQYDKLNPKKNGTDGSGKGSYQTGINFNFQKVFEMSVEHYFRLRCSLGWLFLSSHPHIKGLSTYGGAPNTNGKAYPGQRFVVYLSGEYTITQNWGFAFDTVYNLNLKERFSGDRGMTEFGEKAFVGHPLRQQISFAPAVEYHFNKTVGVIGGVWFSLAGQNTLQFFSGVLSVLISY